MAKLKEIPKWHWPPQALPFGLESSCISDRQLDMELTGRDLRPGATDTRRIYYRPELYAMTEALYPF